VFLVGALVIGLGPEARGAHFGYGDARPAIAPAPDG